MENFIFCAVFLAKSLFYSDIKSDEEKILVLERTCVAVVNVNGATIHSALGFSADCSHNKCVPKLSDKKCSTLQTKYFKLSVIITDNISMVSNRLLLRIHQRLVEIFGCSPNIPFAGVSLILCGDFYQLP